MPERFSWGILGRISCTTLRRTFRGIFGGISGVIAVRIPTSVFRSGLTMNSPGIPLSNCQGVPPKNPLKMHVKSLPRIFSEIFLWGSLEILSKTSDIP